MGLVDFSRKTSNVLILLYDCDDHSMGNISKTTGVFNLVCSFMRLPMTNGYWGGQMLHNTKWWRLARHR